MEIAMIRQQEEWRDVTSQAVPNIRPIYKVSNFGNVCNKNTGRMLKSRDTGRGYMTASVLLNDGRTTDVRIHRLVKLVFDYISGCENLEVDHKNAYKSNNSLYNLDWVTYEENRRRAVAYGLIPKGENHPLSALTDMQVYKICECLQDGMSYLDISNIIGPVDCDINRAIYTIHNRINWLHISCNYIFPPFVSNVTYAYTDQQVYTICNCMMDNKTTREILVILGYNPSLMDANEFKKHSRNMSNIRSGITYKYITNKYIFPTIRTKVKYCI